MYEPKHETDHLLFNGRDEELTRMIATVPGVIELGPVWIDDQVRIPLQPLLLERACGDVDILRALGKHGKEVAELLEADVIVGGESCGISPAVAIALATDKPFAFARKPEYQGHISNEPQMCGASVLGKRVLLVDDTFWRGRTTEHFVKVISEAGGDVVGGYCMSDHRPLAQEKWLETAPLNGRPVFACSTQDSILTSAAEAGIIDRESLSLIRACFREEWKNNDPGWDLLEKLAIANLQRTEQ